MNVTAASHTSHQAHRAVGKHAEVAEVAPDEPKARGGSSTPFDHALHQGNGKKVGIHRRLPTPEDVAAEQVAAGLDPAGGEVAGTEPTEGATESVVETAPVVIDGGVVAEGGTVLELVGDQPSAQELLAEAVEDLLTETDAESTEA